MLGRPHHIALELASEGGDNLVTTNECGPILAQFGPLDQVGNDTKIRYLVLLTIWNGALL